MHVVLGYVRYGSWIQYFVDGSNNFTSIIYPKSSLCSWSDFSLNSTLLNSGHTVLKVLKYKFSGFVIVVHKLPYRR